MNILDVLLKKVNIFDARCEYTSTCAMYKDDSYICTKEVDKSYCGVYKQLLEKA
jgi:hypothetical protein